jgi:hypothetical protein
MPPPQGIVIWRFTPPAMDWDGQFLAPSTSIGDAYDFTSTSPYSDRFADLPECYEYKRHTTVGTIYRLKCAFSLGSLPELDPSTGDPEHFDIVNFPTCTTSDGADLGHENLGYITIGVGGTINGIAAGITAGVTYNLETFFCSDVISANYVEQIWIDDVLLWSKAFSGSAKIALDPYVELQIGFIVVTARNSESNPNRSITLHIEDIVWTMERFGIAQWTMMAPGIGA